MTNCWEKARAGNKIDHLFLFCSYPLINIPLPGTIPTKIVVPYEAGYGSPTAYNHSGSTFAPPAPGEPLPVGPASPYNGSATNRSVPPLLPWAQSRPPFFFVQQITLRASVLPWAEGMQLMDAFRAPLYEVFKLLEIVRNHQSNEK